MQIKKTIVNVFLLSEMVCFIYLYLLGTNGIKILQNQRLMVYELRKELELAEKEVKQLQEELYVWQTDDFYKEKVTREQLQMARKDDKLFYINL